MWEGRGEAPSSNQSELPEACTALSLKRLSGLTSATTEFAGSLHASTPLQISEVVRVGALASRGMFLIPGLRFLKCALLRGIQKNRLLHRCRRANHLGNTMRAAMRLLTLRNRDARRFWVLLSLLLFLTLDVVASSPSLHKAFHHDANTPNHRCVVTLLIHGLLNAPAVFAGLVAFVGAVIFQPLPARAAVHSSFDYRFSPSRAPPLL